jgi:hypothetical protein
MARKSEMTLTFLIRFNPLKEKMKMKWTMKHDEICVRLYIENVIIERKILSGSDIDNLIDSAKEKGVPQSKGSIKMKFQNIKSICDEEEIKHFTPFTGLIKYSQQNKTVFDRVKKDYEI